MKTTYLIATAVIGAALAAPLAAHHNAPFELEIGDMMERHENAIQNLELPTSAMGAMDPSNDAPTVSSDGSRTNDIVPQPNGIGTPEEPGGIDGGNTAGEPWPE
ncbi:MAG: hypothetical protein U9Q81_19660 [Pseudomonadota bacterium]|nr:hypothetical protein [Pseudomonadota bacterium]